MKVCTILSSLSLTLPNGAGALTQLAESLPEYGIEELARGLRAPWALAFLPGDEGILITEKRGDVRLWTTSTESPRTIAGGPSNIFQEADGGLLDITLDPGFSQNRFIYISFLEGTDSANRTALFRATFDGTRFVDGQIVFRASPDKIGPGHPGSRLLFLPDHTLLMTIGDGYDYRNLAQSLSTTLGKIIRLNRDGSIPQSNPFLNIQGARPEIFTFGHRNSQGLMYDPRDSTIWSHEHGPKGGDELNLIQAGQNYGWPTTTYGVDYDGSTISQIREAPGIQDPQVIWVPSIAPSGLTLYLGDRFPQWYGDFFVGTLAGKHLRRLRLRNDQVVIQEMLLDELDTRIRDVRAAPDGFLYILTDDATDGRLLRVVPR